MPASIEQELDITTTVAYSYKCCADHSVLMTSPLITVPADGSHSLAGSVSSLLWTAIAAGAVGAVFSYTSCRQMKSIKF